MARSSLEMVNHDVSLTQTNTSLFRRQNVATIRKTKRGTLLNDDQDSLLGIEISDREKKVAADLSIESQLMYKNCLRNLKA